MVRSRTKQLQIRVRQSRWKNLIGTPLSKTIEGGGTHDNTMGLFRISCKRGVDGPLREKCP